jgi:DNA-binding response OmpR family regulator
VPHILVLEDDPQVRRAVLRTLADRGYATSSAGAGMTGLEAALRDRPDLVLLDLGLPDVDGHQVLRMIRAVSRVPVIVATARDDESEIVRALDSGADDYLVKPFGGAQLEARIRAVLRRVGDHGGRAAPVTVGGLELDLAGRTTTLDGRSLELTPREFDLLRYLAERAGQVVGKRELLAEVWHLPYGGADKTVDVHLSWLRRKLGETAQAPRYLHTVRGVGVRLAPPQSPARQSPARQSPARQSPARQSPARQSPARQSPARQSPARQSPPPEPPS